MGTTEGISLVKMFVGTILTVLVISVVLSIYYFAMDKSNNAYTEVTDSSRNVMEVRLLDMSEGAVPEGILVGNVCTFVSEYQSDIDEVEVHYNGMVANYPYTDFSRLHYDMSSLSRDYCKVTSELVDGYFKLIVSVEE